MVQFARLYNKGDYVKIATVDIGTNSTRLLIADVNDGNLRTIIKKGYVTRLGEGVREKGVLSKKSIEKTLEVLKEFKEIIDSFSVERVVVVTTEAARVAKNSMEFLERVRSLGFNIEVISSREEAEIVFKANVLHFNPPGKVMTVDLGGGSTEIVYGDVNSIDYLESLKFGVVFLNERFIKSDPPASKELFEMESFISEQLKSVKRKINFSSNFNVYAVGGTITSVVSMEERMKVYDPNRVHGYKVTEELINKWYKALSSKRLMERKKVIGLEPGRADVIIPGLAFFKEFCSVFRIKEIIVSEIGLLYGLAIKEVRNNC